MKPYDYMALVPIVEGAGGIMTDWTVGGPPALKICPEAPYILHVIKAGSIAHRVKRRTAGLPADIGRTHFTARLRSAPSQTCCRHGAAAPESQGAKGHEKLHIGMHRN